MNAITKIDEFAVFGIETVDSAVKSIAIDLITESKTGKERAKHVSEFLKEFKALDAVSQKVIADSLNVEESKKGGYNTETIIERTFKGKVKGNSLRKDAVSYNLLNGTFPVLWDTLGIGQLNILSGLESRDFKEKSGGVGLKEFIIGLGEKYQEPVKEKWMQWNTDVSALEALVDAKLHSGADVPENVRKRLNDLHANPPICPCDSSQVDYYDTMETYAISMFDEWTDTELKKAVKAFRDHFIEPKAPVEPVEKKVESESTAKTVKTTAELKSDALNALTAYIERLTEEGTKIPATFNTAVEKLSK